MILNRGMWSYCLINPCWIDNFVISASLMLARSKCTSSRTIEKEISIANRISIGILILVRVLVRLCAAKGYRVLKIVFKTFIRCHFQAKPDHLNNSKSACTPLPNLSPGAKQLDAF